MMLQNQQKFTGVSMPKPFNLKEVKKFGATKALELIGIEYKLRQSIGEPVADLAQAINEILSMEEEIDIDRDTEADAWATMNADRDE